MDTWSHNPSLCQGCQQWNDINFSTPFWDTMEGGLVINPNEFATSQFCIMCSVVISSVQSRLSALSISSASIVSIKNEGPIFIFNTCDTRKEKSKMRYPYARTISVLHQSKIYTSILLHLGVELLEARDDDFGLSFNIEPKVLLTYSNGAKAKLTSTQPWKIPFLSVKNLKWCSSILGSRVLTSQRNLHSFNTFQNPHPYHLNAVQAWDYRFFDTSLIRMWLSYCEKAHGMECRKNLRIRRDVLPPNFRFINTKSMNIERPSSRLTFVALSYLWPAEKDNERVQLVKSNVEQLKVPGSLKLLKLPPIINDAILLCQKLGETHLWIDRLCIVQDDPDSKHSQVSNMHKIYRSASFTIVAALNDRNSQGLPGFSHLPRRSSFHRPERRVNLETGYVEHNMSVVNNSAWNTRGWTFQERVLSTRLLYITEYELYYQCCKGHAYEDSAFHSLYARIPGVPSHPKTKAISSKGSHTPEFIGFETIPESDILVKPAFGTYARYVGNYTSRILSFDSDILNAFAGVEGSLAERYACPFIYGLPEKYLPLALMWNPVNGIIIRKEGPKIPSWSWACLNASSDYTWLTLGHTFWERIVEPYCLRIIILVDFHYQDPQHGLRKLDVMEWWVDGEVSVEEFRGQDRIPQLRPRRYFPTHKRSVMTWKACPHNPWQRLARSALNSEACEVASSLPGCLIFNTTVATVKLRDGEIYSDDTLIGLINTPFSKTAGKMEGMEGERNWGGDIIVISGALASLSKRQSLELRGEDFDVWELRVMLVEQVSHQPYVARRIAVGQVDAHLWKLCAPRWETVILC